MEGTYSLVQRVDEHELDNVRLCYKLVAIIQSLYDVVIYIKNSLYMKSIPFHHQDLIWSQ